ncbi:MAG: Gfo/Idh/MocA family protein [Armatimonadota bacterium]
MPQLNRRHFLTGSLLTGAAVTLAPGRVLGANEEIRAAVIGFKSRGQSHIDDLINLPGVRLVALCDLDPAVLARGKEALAKKNISVDTYADVRHVLDRKDIDVITTATPNHWHSLIGVWACQAGKDSYIEKPISHNVWEGRQLVKAARKHGRIVAGGTQNRSNGRIQAAVDWVRAGNLGKIRSVTGYCFKPRMSIGKVGHGEIPAGLDYNLWTGPAPMKPLARKNLHYDWHWVYDTGNGDMGNQGIHQMDVARWFLGVKELSPRVMSVGGRLGYDDDGETPNTQVVYHDYDEAPLIFETRGLPRSKEFHDPSLWSKNMDEPELFPGAGGISVVVDCEGGKVVVGGNPVAYDRSGKKIQEFQPAFESKGHMANFIEAVRARKRELLTAESEETHLSSALCHTGMISHLLGKRASTEEIRESIKSDAFAAERFEAMREHLARNGVSLDSTQATLGPWLTMDPKREKFTNNKEANALLSREYRKPFTVPEKL